LSHPAVIKENVIIMNNDDFKQEDDEILLLYMAEKEGNPKSARLAYAEFFERYKEFVARLCQSILINIVDGNDANDLCMEVFYRIYERAETFNSGTLSDQLEIRRNIELWINRIARNMFIDMKRVEKINFAKHEEYKPIYNELKKEEPSEWAPLSLQAMNAFEEEYEKLSPRDREIMIFSGLYYDLEKGESDMPSEIIERIALEFGTTSENIRQIRSRFMRRVYKKVKQS